MTLNEILALCNTVKNETAINANTHERIGLLMREIVNYINVTVLSNAGGPFLTDDQYNMLKAIAEGSPKGQYGTSAALTAAFPAGTTGIYVVIGTGHWHYWNGTIWADGGVYQNAVGVLSFAAQTLTEAEKLQVRTNTDSAKAEQTRSQSLVNSPSSKLFDDTIINELGGTLTGSVTWIGSGRIIAADGTTDTNAECKKTDFISIDVFDKINYFGLRTYNGSTYALLALYDNAYAFVASPVLGTTNGSVKSGTIDFTGSYPTAKYFKMSCNANPSYLAAVTLSFIKLGIKDDIISLNEKVNNSENDILSIESNFSDLQIFNLDKLTKRKLFTENLLDAGNVTITAAKTQTNFISAVSGSIPNTVYRGSSNLIMAGTTFPLPYFIKSETKRYLGYCIEFMFSGRYLEIAGRELSYSFTLMVDGVIRVKNYSSAIAPGYDSYGRTWTKVDLGETVTNAHIRLFFYNQFAGIATDGTVSQFTEIRKKIIVDGDSIVEGTGAGNPSATNVFSWAGILSYILNFDLYDAAVGGSGFIHLGNAGEPSMGNRFAEYVQPYNCDIFMFAGGLNDGYLTYPTTVNDAVIAYFNTINEAYKNTSTKIICISPYEPHPATKSTHLGTLGIRDKEKELCVQYGFAFIDLIDGITYDEIGNPIQDSSSTIGGLLDNGREAEFYYDGTHPNEVGHKYIGRRTMLELYRLLM